MVEIHIVTNANRHLYESELEQNFRLRYDIYVKERGWKELDRPDGREIDQFDTENTHNLLAIEKGSVIGANRLVPTTSPTLMSDLFPQLAFRGVIRRPDVYELSRIYVIPAKRATHPSIDAMLRLATMEYGLALGLNYFTIVFESWWVSRLQEDGWRVVPLGLPMDIDGMITLGVRVDVSETAVAIMRRRRNITGTLLVWNGLEKPMVAVHPARATGGRRMS